MDLTDILLPAPAALYDAATGPNAGARKTFGEIEARWIALFAWGIEAKAPESKPAAQAWREFRDEWPKGETMNGLGAQGANLGIAERMAESHGYTGRTKDVRAPDVTDTSAVKKGAVVADETAAELERIAKKKLKELAEDGAVPPVWKILPWYVTAAAIGVGVLFVASVFSPYLRFIPSFGKKAS
jgi:hypothetical protein